MAPKQDFMNAGHTSLLIDYEKTIVPMGDNDVKA